MKALIAITTMVLLGLAGRVWADAPQAAYQLERGAQPHAGIPFTLLMGVVGFDENPPPEQPKLEIPGAKVTPAGAQPNVQRSIQIVNGRRSDSVQVTWVLRWRVEVGSPGRVRIPAATVTQGSKKATAQGAELEVDAVPTTDDMRLELQLPDRPVFVGEMVEAKLLWSFRRQPEDQSFTVPLASMDEVTVSAPPVTDKRRAIELQLGAKSLDLPYEIDQTDVGGQKWTRVSIKMFVAPRTAGKLAVPPATVAASFATSRPDFFGQVSTKLFRTTDVARTLDVKPLPESDRPASFAGAVGSRFSMQVATSRSVVQLGEPVELAITVKSDQRLDTLALGKLDGEGGLPKDKFAVPADPPTGELADDGKTKTFKVTAKVVGQTTEIPALAFAYFDPVKSAYQTIHSDPIALSVKGGSVVGAGDVIGTAPTKQPSSQAGGPGDSDVASVVGELALSAPGDVDGRPLGGALLWLLVGLLYAVPLGIFGVRTWQLRTRTQREEAAEVRAAHRKVEDELVKAERDPARDSAGRLAAAVRALARVLERELDDGGLLARIETESFAPTAASSPLSPDLRVQVSALVKRWTDEARRAPAKSKAGAAAIVLLAALGATRATRAEAAPATPPSASSIRTGAPPPGPGAAVAPTTDGPIATEPTRGPALSTRPVVAKADAPVTTRPSAPVSTDPLAAGRDAYQQAMTITEASARKAAFARAAADLGEAARVTPDRPELLADWGNAALGAGDVGSATLAYRRALAIDPGNARARRNLAWLRSRQPDALRPSGAGAADTLFFFNDWPRSRRLLVGALAFAAVVFLLVPWRGPRRRGLGVIALLPAAIWIAMTVSLVFEDRHANDAVVMDAVVLRAADSAGAPAAMTTPLPRGTEVTIVERRDAWTKVRVAGGTAGWVPDGAVARVTTP